MQLKTVLDKVLALPGAEKPLVALFFRRQMVTIISRALRELDIVPLSSRRCFALIGKCLLETCPVAQRKGWGGQDSTACVSALTGSASRLPCAKMRTCALQPAGWRSV